jgi:hypothetical protein
MRKFLTSAAAALTFTIAASGAALAGDAEPGPLARGSSAGVERNIGPKQTGPRPIWNQNGGSNHFAPKIGGNRPRMRSFGRRMR